MGSQQGLVSWRNFGQLNTFLALRKGKNAILIWDSELGAWAGTSSVVDCMNFRVYRFFVNFLLRTNSGPVHAEAEADPLPVLQNMPCMCTVSASHLSFSCFRRCTNREFAQKILLAQQACREI